MKYADLHVHTCISDGSFTPAEVVNQAISANLSAIAITDHDSVDAVDEAVREAGDKIEIIPGVELTAEMDGNEIHILGYFIDWRDAKFRQELESLQKVRLERARKIVEKLKQLGMEINYEELLKFSGRGSVGRLHIARMMKSSGYVSSIREAFWRFLGEGKPACVGKFRLSPRQAMELIRNVGGLAVLAHPYLLNHDEWISQFADDGLDGIEVYYSIQNPQITGHYERLALKNELLMTGGSDCHGQAKGRVLLGKVKIPYSLVEKLKKAKIEKAST